MSHTLIIARHGEVPDDTDYLTARGLSQAFQVADRIFDAQLKPGAILYSPVHRTFQTASGLKEAFDGKGVHDIALSPAEWLRDRIAEEMIQEFKKLSDGTVVVTHHREMMKLAAYWGMEREPAFGEAWIINVDSPINLSSHKMPGMRII